MHLIKIILFHFLYSCRPIVKVPCKIFSIMFLIGFALTTFTGSIEFKLTWPWLALGLILPVISWYNDSLLLILMPEGAEDTVV